MPTRNVFECEVAGDGAYNREAPFLGDIADCERNGFFNARVIFQLGIITVGQIFDGGAHTENRVQDQLQCASLGADNQVVSTGGLVKHAINDPIDDQDRNHQCHTQGNAECRQQ